MIDVLKRTIKSIKRDDLFRMVFRIIKNIVNHTLYKIVHRTFKSHLCKEKDSIVIDTYDVNENMYSRGYHFSDDDTDESKISHSNTRYLRLKKDIDMSDFENLVENTDSSHIEIETIQQWITSGVLFPQEVVIAEKLIKKIRERTQRN